MPHITMIYPFRPRENFDELAEQFYPTCQNIQPFQIRFNLINQFQHPAESYTLWLAPEPKEPIIDLQAALLNLVPDCNDVSRFKNGFTPHLSLGQVTGKSAMLKLKDALQTNWKLLSFMVNEICFIWRDDPPDDMFRVSHRIKINALRFS
jgi:2'-5' RNA ligase